ncbi:molybdenum cofactor biosynthesis protein MoaE [Calidifontibacter sp. DB0510]|uniref:Molybdenum cofactor biosynthesis protein MoaE n=1 Tax=Metallococcus carri TaxID=1656884 RepID=A0A967EFB3_9MICO|nr:molybdenum cofactor biosynthesis protein MoaE [Metallococcus carri]NHN56476.1 molybdenum cofactor biosynthesis protein MoaE [Metallococcus carri]NOP36100.1 molybdenum cofactor biosynthesis protein MoaE [Calidifontibacter sp. DB2511S]
MSEDPRIRLADLRDAPLSVDEVLAAVSDAKAGGVALFVGRVRDHDHGESVQALDYTAHPTAVDQLRQVAAGVLSEELIAVAAVHRIGHLRVGDIAVVVGVGAAHRGPALAACEKFIDTLKQQVPIWKHQIFADGSDEWVGLT